MISDTPMIEEKGVEASHVRYRVWIIHNQGQGMVLLSTAHVNLYIDKALFMAALLI